MSITAIILAAGRSSRMGRAKQLLPLGASTVLAKTVANVQSATIEEIVVVLGASAEAIRPLLPENLKLVHNPLYQQGIATSLRAGLSAADPRSEAALIVLGDQPFILPQTLDQIIAEYRRTQAHIVIPTYQGTRGNPVLLDRALFPEVMALEGDTGCRSIFPQHQQRTVRVEVADQGILLDLDRPEDYDRLKTGI